VRTVVDDNLHFGNLEDEILEIEDRSVTSSRVWLPPSFHAVPGCADLFS